MKITRERKQDHWGTTEWYATNFLYLFRQPIMEISTHITPNNNKIDWYKYLIMT